MAMGACFEQAGMQVMVGVQARHARARQRFSARALLAPRAATAASPRVHDSVARWRHLPYDICRSGLTLIAFCTIALLPWVLANPCMASDNPRWGRRRLERLAAAEVPPVGVTRGCTHLPAALPPDDCTLTHKALTSMS